MSATELINRNTLQQPRLSFQHGAVATGSNSLSGVQRNSFGQINFSKPVNKLVSDVAQAIGESVRRMQPRSQ